MNGIQEDVQLYGKEIYCVNMQKTEKLQIVILVFNKIKNICFAVKFNNNI